jgi:hypothetical protein
LAAKNAADHLTNTIVTRNCNSERNLPLAWPPKMLKEKFKLYTVEEHHGEQISVLGQIHRHAPVDEHPYHSQDQ